jgi:hypothetical protein
MSADNETKCRDFPMHLSTARYLAPPDDPIVTPQDAAEKMGWTEVSKGLFTLIAGYVLGIVTSAATIFLIWEVTHGARTSLATVTGDDYTVLLIGGAISFFASLGSSYLILRGKWRCVISAPERCGAKWFVFASMICVLSGPALHYVSGFAYTPPRVRTPGAGEVDIRPGAQQAAVHYVERLRDLDASSYMRVAGSILTPLGPIFFALFLRAVHRCLGSIAGVRLTDLYLLLVALLFVASLALLLDPRVRIRFDLLTILGLGWLAATVFYFVLVVGAMFTISAHVNGPRQPAQAAY